jgi:glycosyltransferase involved in cell wall biosynthesis
MAERVVALLSDPRELARQRERAQLRATETFSTAKIVDRYEALYRRLLGR